MKKWVWVAAIFLVCVHLSGCASVQKKFTRKRKEPSRTPVVIYAEAGSYQKKYSSDYYYKIHFVQWKSWHADLLNDLGGNSKKLERDADETLNHLESMNRYLNPHKQAELKSHLESFKTIARKIQSGHYTDSGQSAVRSELEILRRVIANNFYYSKVAGDLVREEADLGSTAEAPPVSEGSLKKT